MSWTSSSSHLLMNPHYSTREQTLFNKILTLSSKQFPAHIWVSTSGSTSPKWVGLSKQAILVSAHAVNMHLESSSKDIWIHSLPDFHVGGLGIWARSHLSKATVKDFKKIGKWDAELFYKFTHDSKGTLASLVPAQLHDLVQLNLDAPKSLRAIIIGGGRLAPELYLNAIQKGWKILPSYGLTECASQVATAELDSWKINVFPPLKILSHIYANQENSQLKFKGHSLLSTYAFIQNNQIEFHDPKKDGWFLTEDQGSIQHPYLQFQNRIDQIIKIGGENVDFNHLEILFHRLQPSLDMALVAFPDKRLGTVIHMAIANTPPEIAQSIQSQFNLQVLPFERIRKIHFVPHIPRSPLSKILKKQLLILVLGDPAPYASN